jgi:hypothetical protein
MTMRAIDSVGEALLATIAVLSPFVTLSPVVDDFVRTAKLKTETLRTDPEVFEVWSSFVVASEILCGFQPIALGGPGSVDSQVCGQFSELLREGSAIVSSMARARVPMPKTTQAFLDRCEALAQAARIKKDAASKLGAATTTAPGL